MSLLQLPPELLLTIAEQLSSRDQSHFLSTNIYLANLFLPVLYRAATQGARAGGLPLLHWAVLRGNERLLRTLLHNGVSDIAHPGYCKYTALHLAVAHGPDWIVRILLEGENLPSVRHVRDPCGRTPLRIAIMRGSKEVVEMLGGE